MHMKKNLKGFTLIELIIVLAIFGLILTVVMSFIDPVGKIMKKTSTRERTAAYTDNISEYIDNSLHYAKYMRIYEGGFCQYNTDPDSDAKFEPIDEETAVKNLIDGVLNDAVDKNGNRLKGNVRVMKFINTGDGSLEPGHIYETCYDFSAGAKPMKLKVDEAGFPVRDENSQLVYEPYREFTQSDEPVINAIANYINRDVINDEHYEEYSYYFKSGFYTLDPLSDTENYSDPTDSSRSFASTPKGYYSKLVPIRDISGDLSTVLNINVVSYLRDGNNKIENIVYKIDETASEEVTLFRSPAHLNSASMSLINVAATRDNQFAVYIAPKRDNNGEIIANQFVQVTKDKTNKPLARFDLNTDDKYTGTVTDNIYVVYIMPNELSDVEINYKSNSNAPEVP